MDLEELLQEKPKEKSLPDKPIVKPEHANPTQNLTREREIRNFALLNRWENESQRIKAIGVCFFNIPWKVVDRRVKSHIFLSLREERGQKLQIKNANVEISEHRVTTVSLLEIWEDTFKSLRNLAFDVFALLFRKSARNGPCETVHPTLRDLARVCNLGKQ